MRFNGEKMQLKKPLAPRTKTVMSGESPNQDFRRKRIRIKQQFLTKTHAEKSRHCEPGRGGVQLKWHGRLAGFG